MDIPTLIMVYVIGLLVALCGVGIWSDLRRRSFHSQASDDRIFRCIKCGHVYTDDPDVDRSRCTHCGKMNEPVRF
jgi:hypothetical protein